MYTKKDVGIIGEFYVQYRLAKEGISSYLVPMRQDYDILTQNDQRIEVKTATPSIQKKIYKEQTYSWELWQFRNARMKLKSIKNKTLAYETEKRDRNCDYYIFVCLGPDYTPVKCFIVPNEVIKDKMCIVIQKDYNSFLKDYEERWDLLKTIPRI